MFDESDRVPLERNDENDRGQMIVKGFGQGVRLNARKRLLTKSWQESNREETGFLDSWQRKQRRRNEISSLLAGRDNTGFRITAKRVEKSSKRIHSQCSRWNIRRCVGRGVGFPSTPPSSSKNLGGHQLQRKFYVAHPIDYIRQIASCVPDPVTMIWFYYWRPHYYNNHSWPHAGIRHLQLLFDLSLIISVQVVGVTW